MVNQRKRVKFHGRAASNGIRPRQGSAANGRSGAADGDHGLTLALVFSLGIWWESACPMERGPAVFQSDAPPASAPGPDEEPEVTKPATEPVTEPATEPTTEPATQPATQPPTEPVTQPVSEPGLVAEPAVEEEATEPPATEPASSEPDGAVTGYILPNSSTEYLTWEDYGHLSLWELVLARNEIFARHGRLFHDPDIQAYFNSCSWYEGTVAPEDFDTGVMSDIEVQNVWTLKAAEG